MFFFLPTGQSGERSRRPVITITLAALCVAVFIATSMSDGPQLSGADETDLVEWVDEHPWVLPGYDGEKPDSAQVRDDTRVLRQRIDGYADLERRLSLVPERGFAQVGWLTNLFVHFDLFHLLGNLLFLFIVGPLLEEAWGRTRFTVFYLAAGLFASAVQFVLNRHEFVAIGGASGAIAGAMGAFAVRFATERIRFHYFIWFLRIFAGEVWVPAWLCGVAWFGNEVWNAASGSAPGVATGAHIGGFVLGALTALLMGWLFQDTLRTDAEHRDARASLDQQWLEATSALSQHDFERARELALAVQQQQPSYPGLLPVLAEAELRSGRGQARVERVLRELMTGNEGELLGFVARIEDALAPSALSPSVAWALAERLQRTRTLPHLAQALVEAVAAGSGALALKARAQLAPPAPAPVRVVNAAVRAVRPEGLTVDVDGHTRTLAFSRIAAVHAGTVGSALMVDIVLREPLVVLRLSGTDAGVLTLFPGQPPQVAWQSFLGGLRRAAQLTSEGPPWLAYPSLEHFSDARPTT